MAAIKTASTKTEAPKAAKASTAGSNGQAAPREGKGLRKQHLDVLRIMAKASRPLSDAEIGAKLMAASGAKAYSLGYCFGRNDPALDQAFRAKFGPTLISLGLAKRVSIDDGANPKVMVFEITAKGKKALAAAPK